MKHILRLSNGTELSSGQPTGNAIQSITITQCVNDSQTISLGSAGTNMLQAELITPDSGLSITAGEELTLFVQESTQLIQLGVFIAEKPVRPTAHSMQLTAYDRMIKLDKDLSAWLASLTGWPYRLIEFASMVCEACGLELCSEELPNGEYMVRQFYLQGVSGRKLMQWVGQIAGRFCRTTPDGKLELAWYTPSAVTITPNGECHYYENALTVEDYVIHPIEKVQIQATQEDVGAVWPDEAGEKNTYRITGNYLLTAQTTADLQSVAQVLYEQMKDVAYTPCTVEIPTCRHIRAGDIVTIFDRNGKSFTSYVMQKTYSNQRDTLECTGSYRLDRTAVFNDQSYGETSQKLLELSLKMEGMSVKASDLRSEFSSEVDNLNRKLTEESTSVLSDCNQILMTALQSYVQTSNYEQFRQTVESQVKLLRDEFSIRFEETASKITEVDGDLQEKFNQIATIFEFTINGFKIGKIGSPYKIFLDDNEFSMMVNDERVLWFELSENSHEANIPELNVTKKLNLFGYLIDMDSYGNVNCEHVGGDT